MVITQQSSVLVYKLKGKIREGERNLCVILILKGKGSFFSTYLGLRASELN